MSSHPEELHGRPFLVDERWITAQWALNASPSARTRQSALSDGCGVVRLGSAGTGIGR
jgi:hypothetical protein